MQRIFNRLGLWLLGAVVVPVYQYWGNYPQIRWMDTVLVVAVLSVAVLLVGRLLRLLVRDASIRLLLAYGFWSTFWFLRPILHALKYSSDWTLRLYDWCYDFRYGFAGTLFLLLLLLVWWVLRRRRRWIAPINAVLGISFCAVTVLLLVQTVQRMWEYRLAEGKLGALGAADGTLPNIYHILLDAHPNLEGARQLGYDLQPFYNALSDLGFITFPHSRSNYPQTHWSVSSMLTMDYLPKELIPNTPAANREHFRLAQNPPVWQTLRAHGYTLSIQVSHDMCAPFYPRALLRPNATGSFLCACIVALEMTPIDLYTWFRPLYCRAFRSKFQAMLQSLCDLHLKTPFVHYLHIVCPHPPFIFAEGARYKFPDLLANNGLPPEQLPSARANIAGIDALVLPILQQIIEKEKNPIIVLHSDHGIFQCTFPLIEKFYNIEGYYGNLLALYIPDAWKSDAKNLHFINLYRFLFNHLFDSNLPYHNENAQKITLEEYLKYGK